MKKLVLDLDETLVYSTLEPIGPDSVQLEVAGSLFYTMLRPGAKDFLEFVAKKFDVCIWSTGLESYVHAIWAYLGLDGFQLWGREHCKKMDPIPDHCTEPYEEPLRQLTEDLSQIVIVDNTASMFAKCPLNGILCRTWRGDSDDTELEHLSYYLAWLVRQPSMQRDHHAWRLETLSLRSIN